MNKISPITATVIFGGVAALLAAAATRTFALTETFIPRNPAKAEPIKPTRKPIAGIMPRETQRITNNIAAITATTLY